MAASLWDTLPAEIQERIMAQAANLHLEETQAAMDEAGDEERAEHELWGVETDYYTFEELEQMDEDDAMNEVFDEYMAGVL